MTEMTTTWVCIDCGGRQPTEGNCVACTPGLEAGMREFFSRIAALESDPPG